LPETLAMLEAGRYPVWRDDVEAGYARQAACVLTAGGALASPPEAEAFAERLEARHAAHLAGTQIRRDCNPDDRDAPPPPARPAWRRLLGL
jgi:sugar/nucleoside kinase (ribokinase family)